MKKANVYAVYSNSVLATLNARQAIRELGDNSEDDDLLFTLQPTFLKGTRPLDSGAVGGRAP